MEIKVIVLSSGARTKNSVIYAQDYNRFTSSRPGSAYDEEHLVHVPDDGCYEVSDGMLYYHGEWCEPVEVYRNTVTFLTRENKSSKLIDLKISRK